MDALKGLPSTKCDILCLCKKECVLQIGIARGNEMFEELGISFGTALIVLLALYFIISVCFQFKKVLKYKHLRLICDIIGAKKQRVNAQKPCT